MLLLKILGYLLIAWFIVVCIVAIDTKFDKDFKTKSHWYFYPSFRFATVTQFPCNDRVLFYFSFLFFFHLTIEAR